MKFADIPALSTEKLIEIAEHYEARAKQYTTRTLKSECKMVAKMCREEIAKRS